MTSLSEKRSDLLVRVEQLAGDDNDVDSFGMDSMTRKRLKVGKLMQKKKVKPRKPMRTKLPYSMAKIPKLSAGEEKEMSTLRKRGYLGESMVMKSVSYERDSGAEEGSYQRLVSDYFRTVISRITKKLPSSFVKRGTKAAFSVDYYSGSARGESENFEWSIRVNSESRDGGRMTGNVSVAARVGTKQMSFIVDGKTSPDEFVGDVADWMISKEVVRAR